MTRSEICGGRIQISCIDHCYSDAKEKITGPFIETVGDSDHMGVRVLKFSRCQIVRPQTIRKRCYRHFDIENFLLDIFHSNINNSVTSHNNIEGASEAFENEFLAILDSYAPVKTIQIRKNYCPYRTSETKMLLKERNILKETAYNSLMLIYCQNSKIKLMKQRRLSEMIRLIFQSTV